MKITATCLSLALWCTVAGAQAPAAAQDAFLSADEVKALATGKKWTFQRSSDSNKVRWDLRDNGSLFGNNITRNSSDSGKWKLNDQGQVCTEWRGNSANACYGVRKKGDKMELVAPTFVADLLSVE